MKSRRMTAILTILAVVFVCAVPSAATADSLLSGYGSPGEGNQVILGSALLNGPTNGGGGTGSGGGSTTGGGSGGSSASDLAASSGATGQGPEGAVAPPASKTGGRGSRGAASAGRSPAPAVSAGLARSISGDSATLGISGADLAYIVLALGAVLLTAVLTRRLTHEPDGPQGAAAKGMRRRTRGTD